MFTIRAERPEDSAAIRQINLRAFGAPGEADLVDSLRAARKVVASLVAEHDGQVVGHVLFSPVTVASAPSTWRAVGLAPMCVLPEFQRTGIGSALVRAGLDACRQAGYDAVVVLGHVGYYPRFGFVRALDHGLENEYGATDAFMVLALRNDALTNVRGLVTYASEFREL
jgi:putative acetyltransferase